MDVDQLGREVRVLRRGGRRAGNQRPAHDLEIGFEQLGLKTSILPVRERLRVSRPRVPRAERWS